MKRDRAAPCHTGPRPLSPRRQLPDGVRRLLAIAAAWRPRGDFDVDVFDLVRRARGRQGESLTAHRERRPAVRSLVGISGYSSYAYLKLCADNRRAAWLANCARLGDRHRGLSPERAPPTIHSPTSPLRLWVVVDGDAPMLSGRGRLPRQRPLLRVLGPESVGDPARCRPSTGSSSRATARRPQGASSRIDCRAAGPYDCAVCKGGGPREAHTSVPRSTPCTRSTSCPPGSVPDLSNLDALHCRKRSSSGRVCCEHSSGSCARPVRAREDCFSSGSICSSAMTSGIGRAPANVAGRFGPGGRRS